MVTKETRPISSDVRKNIEKLNEVRTVVVEFDGMFGDEGMLRRVLEGQV
jgi:hypothetical protein